MLDDEETLGNDRRQSISGDYASSPPGGPPEVSKLCQPFDEEDLCCCEYVNAKGERSHLLGFCCDCDTLDDSVERLIRRQNIPNSHFHDLCATVQDRLRIPWRGGAKRINLLAMAPIIVLPLLGYFSTFGPFSTFVSFLLIPIFLRIVSKCVGNKRTPFHYSLSISSLLYCFLVIHSLTKNNIFWFTFNWTFLVAILGGMHLAKWRGGRDWSLNLDSLPFYYYCRKCQFYINGRDHHCNWLDCCVGQANRYWFMLTISLAITWILGIIYSYYCSLWQSGFSTEVIYKDFSNAISFSTAVYGIIILLFLVAILSHQLNMVWKGMSYLDWKFKKNLK